MDHSARRAYLASLLTECTPSELLFISTTIAPLLKRDFIRELPTELSLYILSFIDEPRTLSRASQVSRHWRTLLSDEWTWKRLCELYEFDKKGETHNTNEDEAGEEEPLVEMERFADYPMDPALQWLVAKNRKKACGMDAKSTVCMSDALRPRELLDKSFSYRRYFKYSYKTSELLISLTFFHTLIQNLAVMNWRSSGRLLRAHRVPVVTPDSGVITSVALDADWVVVGLANCRIHVFSARTGVLSRTLIGHELGVWAVCLVSKGGEWIGNGKKRRTENENAVGLDGLSSRLAEMGTSAGKTNDPPGLDHLVPPSLRTALGLGEKGSRFEHRGCEDNMECESDGSQADADMGPGKRSDECCATEGWGQPNALVVSGGCDKVLRVWDVKSG